MTMTDLIAALAMATFPSPADLVGFATLALTLAAPLAFILAWNDKQCYNNNTTAITLENDIYDRNTENAGKNLNDVEWIRELEQELEKKTWRQRAHNLVDAAFDQAEASIDSSKDMISDAITATKETAFLATLPFVLLAEDIQHLAKWAQAHSMAISATTLVVLAATAFPDLALAFGVTLGFGYAAVLGFGYAAVKVKALVEARFQRKAKALGFLSPDEVQELIAKIQADETPTETESEHATETEAPTEVEVKDIVEHAVHAVQLVLVASDFNLSSKGGRADARAYLQQQGIEVAAYANRYQISKKFAEFEQLN